MKVSDTGEFGFIDAIKMNTINDPLTVVHGIGDDCAVYRATSDYDQLITTDMMVEDIHFSKQTTAPFDVGYRLGAANISDIAAMGGIPRQAVIAVAMPINTDLAYISSIFNGLKLICGNYKINLIGGDTVITKGSLTLSLTVIGEVPKGQAVMRSGAHVGDLVIVTHTIGNSAAGLALLLSKIEAFDFCKKAHQQPEPQIELGCWLRQKGATSLNDISDGLSSELNEIAKASRVNIEIKSTAIPIHEETKKAAQLLGINPLDWALYGGEDFQLVGTMPATLGPIIEAHNHLHCIGQVKKGSGEVILRTEEDKTVRLAFGGYDHFKAHNL